MKPLHICLQLSALVIVVVFSYYLGKPIYWDSLLKAQDASSQAAAGPSHTHNAEVDLGRKVGSLGLSRENGTISESVPIKTEDARQTDSKSLVHEAVQSKDRENGGDEAGHMSKPGENGTGSTLSSTLSPKLLQFSNFLLYKGETHFGSYSVLQQPIWTVPAPEFEMPPLEAFSLTKEMIDFRAEKKVIAVTFANFAFMDFVLNWVKHLTTYEVTNILVGAMDTKILEALFWRGVPVFNMRSNMRTDDVGWGTPVFHKMGREKVILINAFLSEDVEILMCDTDVVFLQDDDDGKGVKRVMCAPQNPLPYFERFPEADILTSSDEVVNSVDDDKLENWNRAGGAYNIGIFHWRPTTIAKEFAKEWLTLLRSDDKIWDQNGFNDLARKKLGPAVGKDGLFYAYQGDLKMGILPISLFCSGHTFFVQELYKKLDLSPYAVHTTFQYGGTEGKRHRLREGKIFYDPPEYFDTAGGYITFKSSIPEELFRGGAHTVDSHFALVNYQLVQIRTSLAVATILNRTLIMPPIWARFDRMWYGHPGKLMGTKTSQPFLCPMDHVFEVNQMLKHVNELEYGPPISFREYSFLDNPLLPIKVKKSLLKVKLCDRNSLGCSLTKSAPSGVLKLPKNSTENELLSKLDTLKDYKILEFSSTIDAFGGFSDIVREAKFKHRIKTFTGIWCCVMDKVPGHIWYDIYWDTKPNWKPVPPATREDDHQPR